MSIGDSIDDVIEDVGEMITGTVKPMEAVAVRIVGDDTDRVEAAQYYAENTFNIIGIADMVQILAANPLRKIAHVWIKAGPAPGNNVLGNVITGPGANVANRQGGAHGVGDLIEYTHGRAVYCIGDNTAGHDFTVVVKDEQYSAMAQPAPTLSDD